MSEKNKKQNRPLNKKEVEEMLERGDFFEGLEIGDVDFSDETFENCVNFQGAMFTGEVSFFNSVFNNGANFREAKFIGQKGVDFSEAKFLGGEIANFIKAEFSGRWGANFSGATFGGKGANFGGAKFTADGCVDFTGAKFSGTERTYFSEAIFSGKRGARFKYAIFSSNKGVDFVGAKFNSVEGVDFNRAIFSGAGGADFMVTQFSGVGGANFTETQFSGERGVDFSYSEFSGKGGVDFYSVKFSGTAGAKFTYAKFLCDNRISFEDVTFNEDCIIYFDSVKVKNPKNFFFRTAYLGSTSFYQTDVEDFNFKKVDFRKFPHDKLNWFKNKISIHREVILDEIWNDTAPEEDQREYNEQYYSQVEIIYRQLKRNFEEKRDYAKAGDFHFGEMEMKRLQKSKFKQYFSLTAFYKYFSGYGQKWIMSFSWFIGFVTLFTFLNLNWLEPIYKLKIEKINDGKINVESFYVPPTNFDSFIFTFTTMTLREDKRFEITDSIGSLFVIFQSAIGPTMLALMFLAIRRQFRR